MLHCYKEDPRAWTINNIYHWITNTEVQPELNLRVYNAESDVPNDSPDKVVQQSSQTDDSGLFSATRSVAQASQYSQESTHSPRILIPGASAHSQSRSSNVALTEKSPHRGQVSRVELIPDKSPRNSRESNVESISDRSIPRASKTLSHPGDVSKQSTATTTASGNLVLSDSRSLAPRSRPNGQRSRSSVSRSYQYDNWNLLYYVVACGMLLAVSCYGYIIIYPSHDKSIKGPDTKVPVQNFNANTSSGDRSNDGDRNHEKDERKALVDEEKQKKIEQELKEEKNRTKIKLEKDEFEAKKNENAFILAQKEKLKEEEQTREIQEKNKTSVDQQNENTTKSEEKPPTANGKDAEYEVEYTKESHKGLIEGPVKLYYDENNEKYRGIYGDYSITVKVTDDKLTPFKLNFAEIECTLKYGQNELKDCKAFTNTYGGHFLTFKINITKITE